MTTKGTLYGVNTDGFYTYIEDKMKEPDTPTPVMANKPAQADIDKATKLYQLRYHPTTTTGSPRQEQVRAIAQAIADAKAEERERIFDKLAELENLYASRKGKKTPTEAGRIIGVQDAMLEIRNLKEQGK